MDKQADAVLPEGTVLGDRSNMVISSTVITNGRALCVVTATGMDTEVGRIAGMLMGEEDTSTPLQRKLAEISKTHGFAGHGGFVRLQVGALQDAGVGGHQVPRFQHDDVAGHQKGRLQPDLLPAG